MWWIKARRAHTVLPAALTAFALLVILVQDTSIILPSTLGTSHVALSLFIPIPLTTGLMMCLESRLPAAEASGTRAVQSLDAGLAIVVMGVAVAMSVLAGALFDLPQAGTAGRNALFLTGLMLCGRTLVGQPAVMIPVAWLVIVVLIGFRNQNTPYPWTIIGEPLGKPHAAAGAILMFIAGIIIQLRTSRKIS
ncbi:hypothetical protein [Streptomyces sp. NPDC055036]